MFIAALFTIAKIWKQPKCPSVDEWVDKLRYMYTMEYYSAIKKKEILPCVTTWWVVRGWQWGAGGDRQGEWVKEVIR